MYGMCEVLGIDESKTLNLMLKRISDMNLTYGKRLLELIEKQGYIKTHMILSKNNKRTSIHNLENIDLLECEKLKSYVDVALSGR